MALSRSPSSCACLSRGASRSRLQSPATTKALAHSRWKAEGDVTHTSGTVLTCEGRLHGTTRDHLSLM
eukprot:1618771-Lingulodinium_polyedra.AAC.1